VALTLPPPQPCIFQADPHGQHCFMMFPEECFEKHYRLLKSPDLFASDSTPEKGKGQVGPYTSKRKKCHFRPRLQCHQAEDEATMSHVLPFPSSGDKKTPTPP
jgi:hypothetical protein